MFLSFHTYIVIVCICYLVYADERDDIQLCAAKSLNNIGCLIFSDSSTNKASPNTSSCPYSTQKYVEYYKKHIPKYFPCCGSDYTNQILKAFGVLYKNMKMNSGVSSTIARHLLPPFSCVIDIGANKGTWTQDTRKIMLRQGMITDNTIFHLYEPNPVLISHLKNKLFKNVTWVEIHGTATTNKPGQFLEFYSNAKDWASAPPDRQTGGSLGRGVGSDYLIGRVETTSLDHDWNNGIITPLASDQTNDINHAFLKIDANGNDMNAMEGAVNLLKSGQITAFQMEYDRQSMDNMLPYPRNDTLYSIGLFFEAFDYEVFLVGPKYIPINFGAYHSSLNTKRWKVGDIFGVNRRFSGYKQIVHFLCGGFFPKIVSSTYEWNGNKKGGGCGCSAVTSPVGDCNC
jgi:FkbM family methyltransferase